MLALLADTYWSETEKVFFRFPGLWSNTLYRKLQNQM